MIRIIVEGDKSRYQFLRSMIAQNGTGLADTSTENLAVQTICLRRPEDAVTEGSAEKTFYSRRLPLNTELIFPAEFLLTVSKEEEWDRDNFSGKTNQRGRDDQAEKRKPWDRILFFDEFPYRTHMETVQQSEKSLLHDPSRCEIILVKNERKALQSDISTEESALEQAREEYLAEEYSVSVFRKDEPAEFLLSPHVPVIRQDSQYRRKLAAVRTRIEEELDFEYELACFGLGGGESIEQILSDASLLASFTQYNSRMNGKNVLVFYFEKARSFFWDANAYIFWNFVEGIYKSYMSDVCLWSMENDLESLKIKVQKRFRDYVVGKNVLLFYGREEDYQEFIHRHPEEMEFKKRIQNFFREELRDLIREQMMERIRKMEVLMDEKVC